MLWDHDERVLSCGFVRMAYEAGQRTGASGPADMATMVELCRQEGGTL